MQECTVHRRSLLAVVAALAMAAGGLATAQDVSLNYESLSSLEEPIAVEIGDVTLALTGLVDTSLIYDSEDESTDAALLGNSQLTASTQLPNRWRVAVLYFGEYASGEGRVSGTESRYSDNAAISVGGMWGTLLGGDVSGVVREQTRRLRGAGNASLAFDDFLAALEDRGGAYLVRLGPWVLGTVVDENGDFDLGAMFQRPGANRDYRLTMRYTDGGYTAADGSVRYESRATGVGGELIFGSTSFDAAVGREELSANRSRAIRRYLSSGIRTKLGVVGLSLEGHVGRVAGEYERSVALGLQYDVARGLSVNLGLNYASARVTLDGASLLNTSDRSAAFSLRYSY